MWPRAMYMSANPSEMYCDTAYTCMPLLSISPAVQNSLLQYLHTMWDRGVGILPVLYFPYDICKTKED